MDPITHTLTGAALGQAGLKRRSPLAWPALLIGANLPDVDVLAYFQGDMQALAFRRGVTHGVLAMLVLPALLVGFLTVWDRGVRRPWHRWRATKGDRGALAPVVTPHLLLVSAVAVWSHPVLDWLNIYGIRLLAPFSDRWFYGDALFIVDPWLWLALALGIWLARLRGALPARLTLVAFAGYAAIMWTGSAVARAEIAARVGGDAPVSVLAAPIPIDPTVRRLLVETETRYLRGRIDFRGNFSLDQPPEGILKHAELAGVAAADPDARAFLFWSRYPYFEPLESGIRVRDARYGWAVTAVDLE